MMIMKRNREEWVSERLIESCATRSGYSSRGEGSSNKDYSSEGGGKQVKM